LTPARSKLRDDTRLAVRHALHAREAKIVRPFDRFAPTLRRPGINNAARSDSRYRLVLTTEWLMLAHFLRQRGVTRSARACRSPLGLGLAAWLLASLISLHWPIPAQATMYKCKSADGRTIYGDEPCTNGGGAWTPRNAITILPSSALTGNRAKSAASASNDGRPDWLKPIDPIGDCKRRGGQIDREMRACRLP